MSIEQLQSSLRTVSDFPIEGVNFIDITPILADPSLFQMAVDLFVERHKDTGVDKLAVIESRGFIFGAAIAYNLGVGLVPVRKKGKLPYDTVEASYDLEYGSATLEAHTDAIEKGERVLLFDDLLATGGTAQAAAGLIEKLGGQIIEIDFLIDLAFLNGREKLAGYDVYSPIIINE